MVRQWLTHDIIIQLGMRETIGLGVFLTCRRLAQKMWTLVLDLAFCVAVDVAIGYIFEGPEV